MMGDTVDATKVPLSQSLSTSSTLSKQPIQIVLPDGYRLSNWRVSDGTIVRIGECIASAIPVGRIHQNEAGISLNPLDQSESSEANIYQGISTNHKRPSRRKRPISIANNRTVSGENSTTSPALGDNTISVPKQLPKFMSKSVSHILDEKTATNGVQATTPIPCQSTTDHKIIPILSRADGIIRILHGTATGNIGTIELCQHPTVIAGLCAVCGMKTNEIPIAETNSQYVQNNNNSPLTAPENDKVTNRTLMTVGGTTVTISESESKRMAQEDRHRLQSLQKLSLVLDLDHTLVHATADPRAELHCRNRSDVRRLILPFMNVEPVMIHHPSATLQNPQSRGWIQFQQHFVKLRPHVKDFLETAMTNYELGVYTAGTREYAEQITMLLARHIVGTSHDQIELDQLRQQVNHLEQLYNKQKQKCISSDEFGTNDEMNENNQELPETELGANISALNKSSTSKQKRVQFGLLPTSKEKDEISQQLETIRSELKEAECLEQQALDLRRKLFGSRVMSRTEAGESGRHVKSLKRIFPCGGSMAAVIDDREDVWANADDIVSIRRGEPPENLLLVRPYHWSQFHGFADVNNASGIDFSIKTGNTPTESDEQLLWTAEVLKRIHLHYYSSNDSVQRSVPEILESMRKEVLKGCNIVLSGLVPLSQQNIVLTTPRPIFVRYAESLGAVIQSKVNSSVTHVVASKDGTDKILSARRIKGCCIVKPSWLMECVWSLSHRDENAHLLGTESSKSNNDLDHEVKFLSELTHPLVDSSNNETNVQHDIRLVDDGSDEDDFAAELENEFLNNTTESSSLDRSNFGQEEM